MKHLQIGAAGEAVALTYLKDLGYKYHAQNVRVGRDEIDLIFFDPGDQVIVLAEVKTRSKSDPDFHPSVNLTSSKLRKMHRAASRWVDQKSYEGGWRLDLICVEHGRVIDHLQDLYQ